MRRLENLLDSKGSEIEAHAFIERHDDHWDWRAELWDSGYVIGVITGTSESADALRADMQAAVINQDIHARSPKT